MSHADELGETRTEAGAGAPGRELRQHDTVAGKGLLRKPAGAAAAILPEILEDVGHLQPLRERHGELGERVVPGGDRRGIGAEELGEHLAHDARDVVAVAVEVARARQPADARAALKLVHAAAHESDAALDRGALGAEPPGHADDALEVAHQVPLGRQRSVREPSVERARERGRILGARHDGREALEELERLLGRDRRLVLDRVGNPAQKIRVGHRGPQPRGQLRNRERKGARHVREDLLLVALVGISAIHLGSSRRSTLSGARHARRPTRPGRVQSLRPGRRRRRDPLRRAARADRAPSVP